MRRHIFVTRDSWLFIDASIEFCVYRDTEDRNLLKTFYRLGHEGDWFQPRPGFHADVASKISYLKRMPAKHVWELLTPMLEKAK